ncbi:Mitotic spindle checkpoint component mad2 [Puccinia graminis f. sp. tritici]|uniref:Mitotic spindle checkpoint component mad2 n=1 Tax=Puccinia graminis f. sp. tritici TaxID=56615 RepID=A0A5B0MDX7_PUCGR|nr:Mitotic spindle checkpoint component mad2 [Puccinia graminis f. sp. tritici]
MSSVPTSRRTAGGTATRVRPARTETANKTTATDTTTKTKKRINLAGSTAVISDYFHYAINCILFQRAIYQQSDFKMVKKFGLNMMIVEDESIAEYLKKIVDQVRVWLIEGKITRLVLVIQQKSDGETVERWEFDVTVEEPPIDDPNNVSQPSSQAPASSSSKKDKQAGSKTKSKSLAEVQLDIQEIIRQIISSVSFLPIPTEPRTFKVLAYTHSVGQDEATEWNDSDAFDITERAERVKLKSFSTAIHRVDTAVDYKLGESII